MIIEKKYFGDNETGGLNADDADFVVGKNQWVNAENVRTGTTDAGVIGGMEAIGSTLLKSAVQPSVTFITLNAIEDAKNNRILFFKFNTTGTNHKIVCFSQTDSVEYDVLLASQVTGGLNFDKNKIIQSRIEGDDLYWTDDVDGNEPRRINIDSGIKLNNPSYDTDQVAYTSPVAQSVINIIRRPPGLPPTVAKAVDGGVTNNFLKYFAGEFAWKYRYRGGTESVFSPPSDFLNYNYEADTFNSVAVTLPTAETIEQDVLIVELAVRFNNTFDYFVVKSWNKNVAAEAAEIAAHNSGTPLDFTFYNDVLGVAIGMAASIKPFDAVPIKAATIEIANNRLFIGNYPSGFTTPLQTSLATTLTSSSSDVTTARIWKSFSFYQIGIRFRDFSKRQIGGVVTNDSLIVDIPDRDYDGAPYVTAINWAVSNTLATLEIPEEAYYYDIVITKNLRTRFFVQSAALPIQYAKKLADGTFTYQNTYDSSHYGLAIGLGFLNGDGLGYIYNEGDFLRLYVSPSTTYELPVKDQVGGNVIVKLENIGDLSTAPTANFEIYTPYKKLDQEPFYTTGASYKINNPTTGLRTYSTLSGTILGDSYRIKKTYSFGFLTLTRVVETMSPTDDKWKDWFGVFGEPSFETLLTETDKPNWVKWSNIKIQGSQVNGLCSFDSLDEKDLPDVMGELRRLQLTSKVQNEEGTVMLAIGEKQTASLYLNEVQLYGSDSPSTLAQAPNVIGTVNVLKGNFGTLNPESATEYRGNVYWLDVVNGRIVQYAGNGLYPISNYLMTRFWKQFSLQYMSMTAAQIEALGSRPFVFSCVDPSHDELLFSIPKLLSTPPKGYLPDYPETIYPFDIWDGQAKTVVYNLTAQPNHWQGAYRFTPEYFISLNNRLYSFIYGHLYEHNQTTSFNNFYGVQYKSKIMFVANSNPSMVKSYNNISIEGNIVPSLTYLYTELPYQQASDLMDFDYTALEGNMYATFYRNKLVPTAIGYNTNGLLTSEKLRTAALKVLIEWNVTTRQLELNYVNVGYTRSLGQTTDKAE